MTSKSIEHWGCVLALNDTDNDTKCMCLYEYYRIYLWLGMYYVEARGTVADSVAKQIERVPAVCGGAPACRKSWCIDGETVTNPSSICFIVWLRCYNDYYHLGNINTGTILPFRGTWRPTNVLACMAAYTVWHCITFFPLEGHTRNSFLLFLLLIAFIRVCLLIH